MMVEQDSGLVAVASLVKNIFATPSIQYQPFYPNKPVMEINTNSAVNPHKTPTDEPTICAFKSFASWFRLTDPTKSLLTGAGVEQFWNTCMHAVVFVVKQVVQGCEG